MIANKLSQMTNLLVQLDPALIRITQLAKAAAESSRRGCQHSYPVQAQELSQLLKGKAAVKRTYHEISCEEETEDDEENEADQTPAARLTLSLNSPQAILRTSSLYDDES